MARCSGSHEFDVVGLTSPWSMSEAAALAWIYHELDVMGAAHLKCEGECEDKDEKCQRIVDIPKDIRIQYYETFDWHGFRLVGHYRATYKGKVTVECACVPKDAK